FSHYRTGVSHTPCTIKPHRGDIFVGTPEGFNISNPNGKTKSPSPKYQSLKRLIFWARAYYMLYLLLLILNSSGVSCTADENQAPAGWNICTIDRQK
ncbi:hypothetical protein, partial [Sphingobacterium cellulitidis]|uniref:hypothetical protein n=1 Tax=Sphingobacterium cellulitidis TaxID=1768011 RepID=UPI001E39A970